MRQRPAKAGYKKGDVLVLFGELFSKGYANGLVDEAEKMGMTIVRTTVGRRDSDCHLRALNDEEVAAMPQPLINVPLEAGFDMEPDSKGSTPCGQLKGIKMNDWDKDHLDWDLVNESRERGEQRFRQAVQKTISELKPLIPKGANILFAHIMAGGVPRAKIMMPVMNKVFKGRGDRFIPSEALMQSQLGQMATMNFAEVTAHTFKHLVELSADLRDEVESQGGQVSYTAYGYHGTEVLIDGEYQWQTYTPYFQGWAKMALEKHCRDLSQQGIQCCVYNCPEILTNSSSIFQGVEVSLYPLVGAIQKEGEGSKYCEQVLQTCRALLEEEHDFAEILQFTSDYVKNPLIRQHSDFALWPQNNSKEQMELMLDSSNHLIAMHKDPKVLMTFPLSEEVFKATGEVMLHDSWSCEHPVLWLNHDIVAQSMAARG
jgi:hypothetical protein